ncbi:MAG: energy-coupling factor ABC transporter ATP-binding protein [Desulfatitalea sp.]|nr:energy-coupling factor ABC transporter ATP-binding protein [Desulfatitalea sp.]
MALFQLDHVVHTYAGRTVLNIDQWRVPAGQILGLCGPNGSGKSTLLKLLGFVERPVAGTIQFQGRSCEPFADAVRGKVVLLPQTSFLLRRSVYSNVAYGLRIGHVKCDTAQRVRHALGLVGLDPEAFAQRPWFALSGGEARRVALAARLVLRPRALLLDEPTASVDTASAQMIQAAALYAHRQWGTSLIIASHDHQWLQDTCEDTVQLFRGKILGNGRKTLIFGPWRRRDDGIVQTTLAEDRQFLAVDPPAHLETAVAAIDARHLDLQTSPEPPPPGKTILEGTIVALGLEKSTDRISVSLAVGGIVFTTHLPRHALTTGRYTPGSTAWIVYAPDQVEWY